MKKILLGALVCAAVAGVVYYMNDPEKFNETLGDLKDKADDVLGKARERADDIISKAKDNMNSQRENIQGLAV